MSEDEKAKQDTEAKTADASVASRINVMAALLTALGAGTSVTLAGGAITLIYFWGLGGVPFGQALNVGAMAGVVLPTALFLFCVFLGMWLAPVWMGLAVADGKSGDLALSSVFVAPGTGINEVPVLYTGRLCTFALFAVLLPVVAFVLWGVCSQTTSGFQAFLLFVFAVAIWVVPWVVWVRWVSRKAIAAASAQKETKVTPAPKPNWVAWAFQIVLTSLCSLIPFGVLFLLANQGGMARDHDPTHWALATSALIALALCGSLLFSYMVLLKRKTAESVNWRALLGVNSGLLLVVMLHLGVSGRTLDVVMVLSSVRVEGVNLTLTEEGCDILSAMKANGWDRSPLPSSKTCVLQNVILESALEPNLQVACNRSMTDGAPPGRASTAHFTLPSKYVLSVRKLGSVTKFTSDSVCDPPTNPQAPAGSVLPAAPRERHPEFVWSGIARKSLGHRKESRA